MTLSGFLLEKDLGRGEAKENRTLFFKTIGYYFYCSFYCFSKFQGGKRLLGGKSRFGRTPESRSSFRLIFLLLALGSSEIRFATDHSEKFQRELGAQWNRPSTTNISNFNQSI